MLLLKKKEFQEQEMWVMHRASLCFYFPPSSWEEGMAGTSEVGVGDYENQ